MKCKWGAIVVDGRNKIGGHVASKNRAGSYFRTKVTPINPQSTAQVNIRNRLSGISTAWRGLTDDQRRAWNTTVEKYARTDIFGDLRNPSGFNLHQMLNNNRLNVDQAMLTTPPLPQAVDAFSSLSVAASASGQTITLTFSPVLVDTHLAPVRATPAISPGITFVKSEYRQLTYINSSQVSPLSIETWYIAKYGAVGAVGTKLFVQMFQILIATGQAGLPIQASCIVAA